MTPAQTASENDQRRQRRQRRWRRWLVNGLLLPPALLYILIENIFWAGAKAALHASRLDAISALQRALQRLPPAAILPLFLIPEVFSHIGGWWATYLLVRRKWAAAITVGLVVKGLATLLVVWIYQSCQPALMSIGWFAAAHGKFERGREWLLERTAPARGFARRIVSGSRSGIALRFAAVRAWLAARLGLARK